MKPKNKKYVSVKIQYKIDRNAGHPHIIIYFDGDMRISVGMTHSPVGKPDDYYQLTINPLRGTKPTYIHARAEVGHKNDFYGKMRTGVMTSKDYAVAKHYADKKRQKNK